MKNILICVEFYNPHIGGAEKHVQLIAEYLFKNNCKVQIATTHLKLRKKKIINDIKINEFRIFGNCVKGYSGEVDKYQKFLVDSKFDIVIFYAAQQWTFDLSLEILTQISSKKIFIPCGFSKLNNIFYKPYYYLIKNRINYFDEIICLSKKYQDYFFCKKNFRKRVQVIYNGAEDFYYSVKNLTKKSKIKKKEIVLLYVSNIKFMKGQDKFLKILSSLSNKKIMAYIVYANIPNYFYFKYLKLKSRKIIRKNPNIKIKFIKNTSLNQKREIFSKCDYFIGTSRVECSPLVMFETLAAGKIYLGTDVGNCKEILKDVSPCYINNNISNIALELKKMINKKLHENIFIKKKIYQHYKKNYDWKILLKKYKNLIAST
tara:strand:+ start:251 stop:1372 length:1122 start_codon:yes stop_codon:yes gene_type:complete